MKKHKSRPLGDLYHHRTSPFVLKVESELANKFMKKFSGDNDNLKVKCSGSNTTAVPSLCVSTLKESHLQCKKETVGLFISNPGKATACHALVDSQSQLAKSETSSDHFAFACLSFDGAHCVDPIKTPNNSEDQQVPQTVYTSQSAVKDPEEDDQDCQVDDSSCQREVNGSIMTSNNSIDNADHANVTFNAASVGSLSPAGLGKSADVQSVVDGPSFVPSIEGEDKLPTKVQNYSGESLMDAVDFTDNSDQLEASTFRVEKDSAAPPNVVNSVRGMEQVELSQKEVTNPNNLGVDFNGKSCVSAHSDTGFSDGNPPAHDILNSQGNKYLMYNAPTTNTQEPPLQCQTKIDNDGSDELVDVRVCDICGDVGREVMLALCSKCIDGAEHIYCMRIKMDRVPEGDWVCEDCMTMQEPKRQKPTEEERLDNASSLLCLKEASKGLPAMNPGIKLVDETRKNYYGKSSCLSGKKRGSDMEVSPTAKRRFLEGNVRPLKLSRSRGIASLTRASSLKIVDKGKETPRQIYSCGDQSAKKIMEKASSPPGHRSPNASLKIRTLQKNVQPLKSYGSARKTLLTQVSSLKITDKSKGAVCKSASVDNQSVKKVEEACLSPSGRLAKSQRGYEELCKGKLIKRSTSAVEVRRLHEDVKSEKNSSRECFDRQVSMMRPKKKLFKSMSFSGVRVGLNTQNSLSSHSSNVKGSKYLGGEKSTEKYGSIEKMSPRGIMPVASSGVMRVNTSRTTSDSEIVKTPCSLKNNIQDSAPKVYTSRTTKDSQISKAPCSSRNNVETMKTIQENENSNVRAIALSGGQKSASTAVARSNGENMLSSDAIYEMIPPTKAKSDPDWKANQSPPLKVELGCTSGVDNELLVASNQVSLVDLHPIKELHLPLAPSAVPGSECIWKGAFELEKGGKLPKDCSGIQAHLSTCASSNVLELVHKFQPKILLKEVARLDIWPNHFERNHPTEQDVAIYFFAEDLQSYSSSYKGLLDGMMENDLALEAKFDGFQFLIFPSSLLPARSQRWNTLFFLWGVFRVKTVDNYGLHNPSLNAVSLKQELESVDPIALQCSVSNKTKDHGGENEVSSVEKCLTSQGTLLCEPDMGQLADDPTEKKCFSGGVLCSDEFQKEDGHINQSMGSHGKTHVFPYDESEKENTVPLSLDNSKIGFCSDGNDKLPLSSFAWSYDPASKLWLDKRLDVASWSSISVDSGPSGSSEGGGCAKSDEGQVEQLQDPSNCRALNLDLCLGSGFEPHREVDLDLVLGFSRTGKYEHNRCPKDGSFDNGDMSLVLSLGMPCSNG